MFFRTHFEEGRSLEFTHFGKIITENTNSNETLPLVYG